MLARLQGIRPDPRRRQIEDPARFQHRKAFCLCHSISPLQGLLAAIVGQPGRKNARILPIRHNKLWREIQETQDVENCVENVHKWTKKTREAPGRLGAWKITRWTSPTRCREKKRRPTRKKVQPNRSRLHLLFIAIVLRQLAANLIPTVSGGAYQDARKVSIEWNARPKHWGLPEFRCRKHQT